METEEHFLRAISKGKHRRGAGLRLRKIIARRELDMFGKLACYCCSESIVVSEATIEHIKPRSLGGTWDIDNLALSHPICNTKRGNNNTARKVS